MQFSELTQAIQEPTPPPANEEKLWYFAKVKWFDQKKGYGFVNIKGIDRDVFLHSKVLENYNWPYKLVLTPGYIIEVSYETLPDQRLRANGIRTYKP